MRVRLVFCDWQTADGESSVYSTQAGVELSLGNLHSGTVFEASAAFTICDDADLRKAWRLGIVPVFALLPDDEADFWVEPEEG